MPYIITVRKTNGVVNPALSGIIALNKEPRASRRKGAQVRTMAVG